MNTTGRVGPEHARKPAELKILQQDLPHHRISDKRLAVGPGHRLLIAVPKGEAPAAGWPILYMLDGNAAFDFLTPELLDLARDLVLVGIGYDTEHQFARELRTLDFTAPDLTAKGADADGLRPDPVHAGRICGGAGLFLDRLTGPLRAAAEEGLAIDPTRRTLWGHSFGGLFTLYAAITRPDVFARFAPISPSIWWDEALIRRIAEAAPRLDPAPAMLVALGDKEKRSGSDGPPPDGPAPVTMAFLADLHSRNGFAPVIHVLKDHVHIQTLAGSYPLLFPFAKG